VARLLDVHRESQAALTVLTAEVDDPSGYGRIVHDKNGTVARIVEERDATADERLITEINTSIMVVRASLLGRRFDASVERTHRTSTTSPISSRSCTRPGT